MTTTFTGPIMGAEVTREAEAAAEHIYYYPSTHEAAMEEAAAEVREALERYAELVYRHTAYHRMVTPAGAAEHTEERVKSLAEGAAERITRELTMKHVYGIEPR